MILSASRRTDIPAFFGDWLMNRLREGFALVRNPKFPEAISKVELSPRTIDCIVFATKNPARKFMSDLDEILAMGYEFMFQWTITPYDSTIEENVPRKAEIIEKFNELSAKFGKERFVWRYDPILLSPEFTLDYHRRYFKAIADKLKDRTDSCIISFLDMYPKIRDALKKADARPPSGAEIKDLAPALASAAEENGITVDTCAERIDLSGFGIGNAPCINAERIRRITGKEPVHRKDKGFRKDCECLASTDIGTYDTCRHGCLYCYANQGTHPESHYDPESPILCGTLGEGDRIIGHHATDNRLSLEL